jgi:hypothetical protein
LNRSQIHKGLRTVTAQSIHHNQNFDFPQPEIKAWDGPDSQTYLIDDLKFHSAQKDITSFHNQSLQAYEDKRY